MTDPTQETKIDHTRIKKFWPLPLNTFQITLTLTEVALLIFFSIRGIKFLAWPEIENKILNT